MNIDIYRDTDGAVFLVFAGGDAGILQFDSDGSWIEAPEVPASAVLQADECDCSRWSKRDVPVQLAPMGRCSRRWKAADTQPCPDCHQPASAHSAPRFVGCECRGLSHREGCPGWVLPI